MKRPMVSRMAAALAVLSLGSALDVAAADPVVYVCRANGIGSPTYVKLDEKLKTVSMGREEGKYLLTLPAIFNSKTNSNTVTWSRVDGKVSWNYTFDPVTGTLVYGWGDGPGDSQQDSCTKK